MPVSSYCNEGTHRACSNTVFCEEDGWIGCHCLCHDGQKALIVGILPRLNAVEAEARLAAGGGRDGRAAAENILSELGFVRLGLAFPGIDTDYGEPDDSRGDEGGRRPAGAGAAAGRVTAAVPEVCGIHCCVQTVCKTVFNNHAARGAWPGSPRSAQSAAARSSRRTARKSSAAGSV